MIFTITSDPIDTNQGMKFERSDLLYLATTLEQRILSCSEFPQFVMDCGIHAGHNITNFLPQYSKDDVLEIADWINKIISLRHQYQPPTEKSCSSGKEDAFTAYQNLTKDLTKLVVAYYKVCDKFPSLEQKIRVGIDLTKTGLLKEEKPIIF